MSDPAGYFILPLARSELDTAHDWYESQQPGLGGQFLDEFLRVIAVLQHHPRIGYPSQAASQGRLALRRFPYLIIYSVEDGTILIRVIGHQRRHPDLWKS